MTDNRNRTTAELRKIFERHNGALGAPGSAAWAFEGKGLIILPKEAATKSSCSKSRSAPAPTTCEDVGDRWMVTTDDGRRSKTCANAIGKAGLAVELGRARASCRRTRRPSKAATPRCASTWSRRSTITTTCRRSTRDFELSEAELQRLSQ